MVNFNACVFPLTLAPKVLSVTENSCQVEWMGAKPQPGNSISYQLQISSLSNFDSSIVSIFSLSAFFSRLIYLRELIGNVGKYILTKIKVLLEY